MIRPQTLSILFLVCLTLGMTAYAMQHKNTQKWQQWHWACEDGRCVRQAGAPGASIQQSPGTCRLGCGHYGPLWPRPTGAVSLGSQYQVLSPYRVSLDISSVPESARLLMDDMGKLFLENIEKECGTNCSHNAELTLQITITVEYGNATLNWSTEEGYSLDLDTIGNSMTAQITSNTVFGARHGLETLSQLMSHYETTHGSFLLLPETAHVLDKPAYPHRGLMLDTARHYFPVKDILRTIDGMGASKLNVFHWHATDSQSFPLMSSRIPILARYGAYTPHQIYKPAEIQHIVKYALARGVRVLLEIDAPAHAGAGWQWGQEAGLGDLVVCWAHKYWRERCIQPPCGQLNPANAHVFRVLAELYRDIAQWMTKGEVFHMGGDEVFFPCWNATSEITDLMTSRGWSLEIADFIRLWAEYQATALRVWDEAVATTTGAPPGPILLWSSHLTSPSIIQDYLPKDRYVIQTWVPNGDILPYKLSELGYKIVVSTKDAWYLDHGFWGSTVYHSWRKAYENTLPRFKTVLGGEACMWSEYVDEGNLDDRIWPRAAAVAERLWTDPSSSSIAAETRMSRHRERLISRGLRPEAIQPAWCYQNEGKCL